MIDTVAILFSTIMCLWVVFRAMKLDGGTPWFGVPPTRPGEARSRREGPTDAA